METGHRTPAEFGPGVWVPDIELREGRSEDLPQTGKD